MLNETHPDPEHGPSTFHGTFHGGHMTTSGVSFGAVPGDRARAGALAVALVVLGAITAGPLAAPLAAQHEVVWVEVDVGLDADGRAEVGYRARWRTSGTDMHGFYFEGTAGTPRFLGGTAELPDGSNVPLDISAVGSGRWDIVLADDRAWGPGEATYFFRYETDLAAAGAVDVTTGPGDEPLVVFNWGPVEWDQPLEHETVTVRFASVPTGREGELGPGEEGLARAAELGLRTEPWVNERYRILYSGTGSPPSLTVLFHQEDVPAYGDHRVQLYLPQRHFPGVASAAEERRVRQVEATRRLEAEHREERRRRWIALGLGALLLLPLLLLTGRKLKGLAGAAATASDVLWERDDWEPPRLRVSSYRVPGKLAELEHLEALTLLGTPFRVLLAMVLDRLESRGRLRRDRRDGALRLARSGDSPTDEEPYQAFVWERLEPELGPVPPDLAKDLGELLVGTVQRKAWDADLDASRRHYRRHFATLFPHDTSLPSERRRWDEAAPEEAGLYYPYWVLHHHRDGRALWADEEDTGPLRDA